MSNKRVKKRNIIALAFLFMPMSFYLAAMETNEGLNLEINRLGESTKKNEVHDDIYTRYGLDLFGETASKKEQEAMDEDAKKKQRDYEALFEETNTQQNVFDTSYLFTQSVTINKKTESEEQKTPLATIVIYSIFGLSLGAMLFILFKMTLRED